MASLIKRIACGLTVVLLLSGTLGTLASSVASVRVMDIYQTGKGNELNVSIKVTDAAGASVTKIQNVVSFKVNGVSVSLSDSQPAAGDIGHILVVDTSKYYSTTLKMENVISVLAEAITKSIPQGHKVMLITADKAGITETGWDTPVEVLSNLNSHGQSEDTECDLYGAIQRAVEIASAAGRNSAPAFISSVFVVTDCMIGESATRRQSTILSKLNDQNRVNFMIAWPYRPVYFRSGTNAELVNIGSEELADLAMNMGGKLIPVTHDNQNGLGTTFDVSDEVRKQVQTVTYYRLNLNDPDLALAGRVRYAANDALEVEVAASNVSVKVLGVPFDSRTVPTPTPTITPTISPTVTPTPVVTPVPPIVSLGQDNSDARKVTRRLTDLYYLKEYRNEFDKDAQAAYDLFCQFNGLKMTDGVFEDGYTLLIRGQPVSFPPPPTSPPPSPTPRPPHDLSLNETDEKNGSSYISQLQSKLGSVGAYRNIGMSYKVGVFDDATLKALDEFLFYNSINNSVANGIKADLLIQILTGDWPVLPTPTPTPTPSPTPTPTPKPPLKTGDKDGSEDTRIRQMQDILKSLNYFVVYDLKLAPGVLDEATLEAVNRFTENNGLVNQMSDGVSDEIFLSLISNQWPSVTLPPSPTPTSFIDGLKEKMVSTVEIASLKIPLWVIVVASAVLLLGIIIVLILLKAGKSKESQFSMSTGPSRPGEKAASAKAVPALDLDATKPDTGFIPGQASGDSDATIPGAYGVPVTIQIEYSGSTRTETPVVGSSYTIGRKDCSLMLNDRDKGVSRRHAELFYRNGQLMIRDLGSVNGTYVDGVQIPAASAQAGQLEVTMPIDMNDTRGIEGVPLLSGAKVRMGYHTLTVTW